ncbi:DMT family transporter [Helicobacter sp. 23-1044]
MQKTFIFLLFVAMFFWGLSWPISKILSANHSPFIVAFGRFALVAVCLLPIIKYLGLSLKVPRSCFVRLGANIASNALYSLVFFYAINLGNAGSAGVITTTLSPILATLLSVIIFGAKLSRLECIGLGIGLISGVFFISGKGAIFDSFNLFFMLAAFLWACVTLSVRKLPLHPLVINFYSAFFSAVLFVPFLQSADFAIFSEGESLGFLLIIALLSTVFGTSIYYKGIEVVGITKSASFTLLVPFFAVLLSFIILGEKPEISTAIGGILAIIAIYLISLYNKKHFRFLGRFLRTLRDKS